MSRFSGRVWLQDKPLAYQLFVKLSVYSVLVSAAAILYMAVCVFSAKQLTGEQWAENVENGVQFHVALKKYAEEEI